MNGLISDLSQYSSELSTLKKKVHESYLGGGFIESSLHPGSNWEQIYNRINNAQTKWNKVSELFNKNNTLTVENTIEINEARISLESALTTVTDTIWADKKKSLKENFRSLLLNVDSTLEEILNSLNLETNFHSVKAIKSINTRIPNLESSVQQSIQEIHKSASDAKSFIGEQFEETQHLAETLTSDLKSISRNATGDIQRQSTTATEELRTLRDQIELEFKQTSNNETKKLVTELKTQLKATSEEITQLKNQAKEQEKELTDIFDKMKEMYRISGDGKLADYNNQQADIEKTSADNLRTVGMRWLGLPITVTSIFIIHYMFAEKWLGTPVLLNLEWILTRFLTISISASIAVYMLKESAGHRAKENLYRQRGTQLATIGAYLADFPDENEKMKVKSNLVNNFYSFHDGKVDTSNVPDPNAQIKEVAELSKSLSKIFPTRVPASKLPQPPQPVHGSQQADQNVTPISETANEKDNTKAATGN
ncbi:hypothetical protein VCR4J2_530053 [Vibrio coralliirubri]|uniref:hypothetical protein n=1 Tax=Vibrio coralliirubri TaxID=1516159 RepID=UPI000630778F|nr:hypothetical protein [Vibrio coralliirubri]CDT43303.1 hypothetical protein VCR4J2_530053 [Vibrio coralliirubri]